ncbi:hypothetical protein M8009_06235 [Halomonas sp. ATCH28]|uniref:Uncharacterized protein n=1 Tax=Halomonas gemina TaxID=2945105 RepID=A0ABT0SZ11_9GAMM|nr:hypothetical protein [Halomonas gemina]MCL7939898.1 hypothetical protein [Halomonas gemina]
MGERLRLRLLPWVNQLDPKRLEIRDVASGKHRLASKADCPDLSIYHLHRPARLFADGNALGIANRRLSIEGQNATGESSSNIAAAATARERLRRPSGKRWMPKRISATVLAVVATEEVS